MKDIARGESSQVNIHGDWQHIDRSIGLNLTNSSIMQIEVLSNLTKFSGKITFYWYQVHIKTANNIDLDYPGNPSWDIGDGGRTLALDGTTSFVDVKGGFEQYPFIPLTFTKISRNLIELKDLHGDIIKLTR